MLRLENIRIIGDRAEADFYPEGEKQAGHIVVDVARREIVEIKHVPEYEFMYPAHARSQLLRMAEEGDTRKSCVVKWF